MSVASDLSTLLRGRGYRRLFTVRMASQAGDGVFEAGLATLFFFSPENAATASGVAAAFAVMLLPFTLVGPWAGVFLDRWRRRQVLVVGNLVRAALAVLILGCVLVGATPAVYVLALLCLSVNRFLLAALSAGLPLVVSRDVLVMANSVTPTMGSIGYGIGIAIGAGIRFVSSDSWVLAATVLVFLVAAACGRRIGRDDLGPEHPASGSQLLSQLRSVGRSMADGARELVRRRTPAYALGVMAVHRFLFGVTFMASILMARNHFPDALDAGGLSTFAILTAAIGVGSALAVVVTPLAHERLTPEQWILVCLGTAALAQVSIASFGAVLAVALALGVLGLAAQGAKIAVDTIVQRDTPDAFRGRAFAFYDVLYNAAFVGAAALAAIALPDSGYSIPVFLALAAGYVAVLVGYRVTMRTR